MEDNLAALRILEHEAQQQREAVVEAQRGVAIFTNRYQFGVDPYLQVVSAQTIALLNERNEVDILRRRMDASVSDQGAGWRLGRVQAASDKLDALILSAAGTSRDGFISTPMSRSSETNCFATDPSRWWFRCTGWDP